MVMIWQHAPRPNFGKRWIDYLLKLTTEGVDAIKRAADQVTMLKAGGRDMHPSIRDEVSGGVPVSPILYTLV